jgi:hypothetical protein
MENRSTKRARTCTQQQQQQQQHKGTVLSQIESINTAEKQGS